MQEKNYFFSKKFKVPDKRPFTAVKVAYATKKASFISIRPKPSGIQYRASSISF